MEELDIDLDRQIDPDTLDVEWLEQANRFYKYSDALDEATNERNDVKKELDQQKEHVDWVKADLELKIRANPQAFDLEKATDAAVKAAVIVDKRYQNAVARMFELREELNEVQGRVNGLYTNVNTMQEKKEALKNLIVLLNQQYFSTPTIPRDLTAEYKRHQQMKKTQKEAKTKVKDRKKRRK